MELGQDAVAASSRGIGITRGWSGRLPPGQPLHLAQQGGDGEQFGQATLGADALGLLPRAAVGGDGEHRNRWA